MSVADQRMPASSLARRNPIVVRLSPQFASRLCARLQRTLLVGQELSGLLFGVADDDLVILQAFKSFTEPGYFRSNPLDGEEMEEVFDATVRAAETDPEVSSLDLIGWFSVRATGGLHLQDLVFHEPRFPRLNQLALILKPENQSELLLEVYSRATNGRLSAEDHCWGALRLCLDIPIAGAVEISMQSTPASRDAMIIRQAVNIRPQRSASSSIGIVHINAGAPPVVPAVVPRRKRRRVPWISSAILFALAAGATFAVLLLHGLPSRGGNPALLQTLLSDNGLGLKVEGQGDRLLLTWNRHNGLVRSASGGTLDIEDGGQHRTWPLDVSQLENGAVLYRPMSGDVTFRLDVRGRQSTTLSESTRVLDGRTGAPAAESSAKPQAGTPQTSPPVVQSKATIPIVPQPSGAPASEPVSQSTSSAVKPSVDSTNLPSPAPSLAKSSPESTNPSAAEVSGLPTVERTATTTENDSPVIKPAAASNQVPQQQMSQTQIRPPASEARAPASVPAAKPVVPTDPTQYPLQYLPPRPTHKVLPDMRIFAAGPINLSQVEVSVKVDKSGHVTEAHVVDKENKIKPALAGAVLIAAKQWTFQPAIFRGQYVDSEHTIVFQFHSAK